MSKGQWEGGKGSDRRLTTISSTEFDLRDALWRAPDEDKPKIRAQLEELLKNKESQDEGFPKI